MIAVDPILIQGIAAGVIANTITGLASHISRSLQTPKQWQDVDQMVKEDTAIAGILQEAVTNLTQATDLAEPQIQKIYAFLTSQATSAIVRQIYADGLLEHTEHHIESIKSEFLGHYALHFGEPLPPALDDLADGLFKTLLTGCELSLAAAIDKGVLSAHEAKSALRYRIVQDEIASINKNLTFLAAGTKPDLEQIRQFDSKYRAQVADRHALIVPPCFDAVRKLPIEQIYVAPDFVPLRKETTQKGIDTRLTTPELLSTMYRIVVVGNPGSGKSTFSAKLCHDLASDPPPLLLGRRVTPILVILRDYGAEKKAHDFSILQFIEAVANSKYQVQPPPGAFEYLLLNGGALVIFDGLDELLDTSYRQVISADIESFCTLYPSVPVLVTSREVGYEQAPLDERRFDTCRLAPFGDLQVAHYARKWFTADTDLTLEQRAQKTEAFLKESAIVSDLRSNPLMLALMCNLYRGENYIPRNRPDVYEKCAIMMFERWDKSRGIYVQLPFEAHIRPAIMYVAHWIYTTPPSQSGLSEKALVALVTDYLCPRRFEDRDEAEEAARQFVLFCRDRAWVFTDVGTTKEGERLYQFTHPTFLEYFAAAYLARTNPTPGALGHVLLPRIAKSEWDVVAQLACQIQNNSVEGSGDEFLTRLLNEAQEIGMRTNLLSFAARNLEFIVPSPKISRDITVASVEESIRLTLKASRRHYSVSPVRMIGDLLNSAEDNRKVVLDQLETLLIEKGNTSKESEAYLALTIGLNINSTIDRDKRDDTYDWTPFKGRIFHACHERLVALRQKHFVLCVDSFDRNDVTLTNIRDWYGVESFFRQPTPPFPGLFNLPISDSLLFPVLVKVAPTLSNKLISDLEEMTTILMATAPPWVEQKSVDTFIVDFVLRRYLSNNDDQLTFAIEKHTNLSPDSAFALIALAGVQLEDHLATHEGRPEALADTVRKTLPFWTVPLLGLAMSTRLNPLHIEELRLELDHSQFEGEQKDFIWHWASGAIDLVKITKSLRTRKTFLHQA